jgi:hypothetical protein
MAVSIAAVYYIYTDTKFFSLVHVVHILHAESSRMDAPLQMRNER